MADVTLWLEEHEWWPWRSISDDEPGDNVKRFYTAVSVDEATARRWREGLAAAEALQDEIGEVFDRAREATS